MIYCDYHKMILFLDQYNTTEDLIPNTGIKEIFKLRIIVINRGTLQQKFQFMELLIP